MRQIHFRYMSRSLRGFVRAIGAQQIEDRTSKEIQWEVWQKRFWGIQKAVNRRVVEVIKREGVT